MKNKLETQTTSFVKSVLCLLVSIASVAKSPLDYEPRDLGIKLISSTVLSRVVGSKQMLPKIISIFETFLAPSGKPKSNVHKNTLSPMSFKGPENPKGSRKSLDIPDLGKILRIMGIWENCFLFWQH